MSLFRSRTLAIFGSRPSSEHSGISESTFLEILYEPSVRRHTVDIVFVHGLNPWSQERHAHLTWTSESDGTLWPKDLLPRNVPYARVMLYGYNSNAAFDAAKMGLEDHANTLLDLLNIERKARLGVAITLKGNIDVVMQHGQDKRPIIFVGHSLGGLVIKQALVLAQNNDRVYGSIKKCTRGLIFFGTPHRGGNGATIGSVVRNIAVFFSGNERNQLVDVVQRDSDALDRLTGDFQNQYEDYEFLSVVETQGAVRIPGGPSTVVVDRSSAVIGLAGHRELVVTLDANHRGISRLGNGRRYKRIAEHISRMANNATSGDSQLDDTFQPPHGNGATNISNNSPTRCAAIPSMHNYPLFGQKVFLQEIDNFLRINTGFDRLVVTGPAGSGKTRILYEVASSTQVEFSVFWFSGRSQNTVASGFEEAFRVMIDGESRRFWLHASDAVQTWLSDPDNGKWIVIIDNVAENNVEDLISLFPSRPWGRVIVASQSFNGTTAHVKPIPKLSTSEALELFYCARQRRDGSNEEAEDINIIIDTVHCHPTAIILAASYLLVNPRKSVSEYLATLRESANISNHLSRGRDTWPPLSVSLGGLASSAAEMLFSVLCLLDTSRISEEFLISCRTAAPSGDSDDRFSFMGYRRFVPAKQLLLSLSLLQKESDWKGPYLVVPQILRDCFLQKHGSNSAVILPAASAAARLLYDAVRQDQSNKLVATHMTHSHALGKIARKEHLDLGNTLTYLNHQVVLHHLKRAAEDGFKKVFRHSFLTWLSMNRTLDDKNQYQLPDVQAGMTELPAPPDWIRPTTLSGKVSPVLTQAVWNDIQSAVMTSGVGSAWFTIKDEMLDIARESARGTDDELRESVADFVDKGAHDALVVVLPMATRRCTSIDSESIDLNSIMARNVLSDVCGIISHGLSTSFTEADLEAVISKAVSGNLFRFIDILSVAWASALEIPKAPIGSLISTLVHQTINPSDLQRVVAFTVQSFSESHANRYAEEIVGAVWETLAEAVVWFAMMIRVELMLLSGTEQGIESGIEILRAAVTASRFSLGTTISDCVAAEETWRVVTGLNGAELEVQRKWEQAIQGGLGEDKLYGMFSRCRYRTGL